VIPARVRWRVAQIIHIGVHVDDCYECVAVGCCELQ